MQILLSGYYGFGNAGDEAILQASIQAFKEHGLHVAVLSQKPEETSKQFNVTAYARRSLLLTLSAIRKSSLVLSGGGGLFQDKTSLKSLIFYLRVLFWAKLFGKKTMIFAQGIGPLQSFFAKRLTSIICSHFADRITVRDLGSKELLNAIGVKKLIEVTADLAFLSPFPSPLEIQTTREQFNLIGTQKQIGIILRSHENTKSMINSLAKILTRFCTQETLIPVLIPFQLSQDAPPLQELSEKLPIPHVKIQDHLSPQQLISVISGLHILAGMRFHSLVFSARCHVPFLGLAYDEKVESLSESLGLPSLKTSEFNPEAFEKTLFELSSQREGLSQKLKQVIPACEKAAIRNIDLALQLLEPVL